MDKKEVIIEQCRSAMCNRIEMPDCTCSVYAEPKSRWRIGRCPMAPYLTKSKQSKKRVGQQKQRKR